MLQVSREGTPGSRVQEPGQATPIPQMHGEDHLLRECRQPAKADRDGAEQAGAARKQKDEEPVAAAAVIGGVEPPVDLEAERSMAATASTT